MRANPGIGGWRWKDLGEMGRFLILPVRNLVFMIERSVFLCSPPLRFRNPLHSPLFEPPQRRQAMRAPLSSVLSLPLLTLLLAHESSCSPAEKKANPEALVAPGPASPTGIPGPTGTEKKTVE